MHHVLASSYSHVFFFGRIFLFSVNRTFLGALERTSVMSYYHGILALNNLSSERRPFALSTDGRIVWATVLFLSEIMHWKVIYVNIFLFSAIFVGSRFVEIQIF